MQGRRDRQAPRTGSHPPERLPALSLCPACCPPACQVPDSPGGTGAVECQHPLSGVQGPVGQAW